MTNATPQIHIRKLLSVLLFGLVWAISMSALGAKQKGPSLLPVDQTNSYPILKNSGYLLLELDAQGVAPALTFSRIHKNPSLLPTTRVSGTQAPPQRIELKNLAPGYYLLELPGGLYQVQELLSPLFNYGYKMEVKDQYRWRIGIEPGHINYFGKISIAKARSARSVDIELLPRFAKTNALVNQDAILLPAMPLRIGNGYRDDYDDFLMR